MGAWIEIWVPRKKIKEDKVAPYMGAWIEICFWHIITVSGYNVAPYMGAWIEISFTFFP